MTAGATPLTYTGGSPAECVSIRYSTVAIVLHWTIAAIILVQLVLGWRLDDADGAQRSALVALHKSIGVSILVLSLVRLGWRVTHRPPPEDAGLTRLERRLSHWVHKGFYLALIALPLTGWAMISARRAGAITLFGALPWPRFPLVGLVPDSLVDAVSDALGASHTALVWVMAALVGLHVAGALKHHFISKDTVVPRMCPGVRPGVVTEPRLLAIAAIGVVLAGLAYFLNAPTRPARPRPTQVAAADLYLDIVAPALDRRCGACHNDDLSRGGLSVDRYDETLHGGRDGPGVTPGAPAKSEILRRVNLPADDPKYMPRDGRTPLTPAQIAVIGWWISVGAPQSGRVADLRPPPKLLPVLSEVLGLAAPRQGAGPIEVLPKVPPGDPAAIDALNNAGFTVRRAARDSNLLDINLYQPRAFSDASLAALAKLQPQVRTLALVDAGVDDGDLAVVTGMENLTALRLQLNPVTDAGAARLAGLNKLRSLNLYGSRVTNASLETLARLPALRRLHVWRTGVTREAAERLQQARPQLIVDLESTLDEAGPAPLPAAGK